MTYNVNFSIGAFFFLVVTVIFYFGRRRIPNTLNRLYGMLIMAATAATFFDALAAIFENYGLNLPAAAYYLVNILFLISISLCMPIFCRYLLETTGRFSPLSKPAWKILQIPFVIELFLVLSSTFWKHGIFYISPDLHYVAGTCHKFTYFCSFFYILVALVIILRARKEFSRILVTVIFVLIAVIVVASVLQIFLPGYLLTTAATALSVMGMYFAMLTPNTYIDSVTGAYNRIAFSLISDGAFENKEDFSYVIVSLRSYDKLVSVYGVENAERVLYYVSSQLKRVFPRKFLFRIYSKCFVILNPSDKLGFELIERKLAGVSRLYRSDNIEFSLEIGCAYLSTEGLSDTAEVLDIINYVITKDLLRGEGVKRVGSDISTRIAEYSRIEADLPMLVSKKRISLEYQTVNMFDGRPAALEVFPAIDRAVYRYDDVSVLFSVAEQSGTLNGLCRCLFDKAFEFAAQNSLEKLGITHIELNAPTKFYTKENCAYIIKKCRQYELEPSCFGINLGDLDAIDNIDAVIANVHTLYGEGFLLLIDDFGAGYINIDFLSKIPYAYIKVHKRLLTNALATAKHAGFLSIIYDTLNHINARVIQKGIDSKKEFDFANVFSVDYGEGNYFSAARPIEELTKC